MMTSLAPRIRPRALTVDSVGSPDGTITHTARGVVSPSINASSVDTPLAPAASARATAFGAAVVGDDGVAAANEPRHHVEAHSAQSNETDLHRMLRSG